MDHLHRCPPFWNPWTPSWWKLSIWIWSSHAPLFMNSAVLSIYPLLPAAPWKMICLHLSRMLRLACLNFGRCLIFGFFLSANNRINPRGLLFSSIICRAASPIFSSLRGFAFCSSLRNCHSMTFFSSSLLICTEISRSLSSIFVNSKLSVCTLLLSPPTPISSPP